MWPISVTAKELNCRQMKAGNELGEV